MMNLAALSTVQSQPGHTFQVPWATLLIVVAGIAILMFIIRGLGFLLARRHPVPKPVPTPLPEVPRQDTPRYALDPQMIAVIAAALSTVLHQPYRITKMEAKQQDYSVESLMNIWSMEGRRQIYDSHKIR